MQGVHPDAVKCRHCGEFLDDRYRPRRRFNPAVAAVLSFLIPGLGQAYKGQILSGLVWLMLVPMGYLCCIAPGVVLWFICIFHAASGSEV